MLEQEEIMIHRAIEFAAIKHRDQMRKGTVTPYIVHIMEVYGILASASCSAEVTVAGILHDTLEDTNTDAKEIADIFGANIARLVESESEDKSKSWQQRKQATIDELKHAPTEIRQICCADKLSNLISMYNDLQNIGDELWKRFNADKSQIKWYYHGVINALSPLKDFAPYLKLKEYFGKVFGE